MQRTFNINDLKRMLRISDPFLFIDSVDNIVPRKSGIGRKLLKQDEWFFESSLLPIFGYKLCLSSLGSQFLLLDKNTEFFSSISTT